MLVTCVGLEPVTWYVSAPIFMQVATMNTVPVTLKEACSLGDLTPLGKPLGEEFLKCLSL